MTKIISRNTTVPTKKSEFFSTAVDNQTNVEIHVLQGERELASDNKSLGEFRLDGIPLAPRSVPKIEVSFDIDVNGILMVKAKDNSTGSEQSITIEGSSRLADDDIERMVKEAETFATADKERRENINLKNEADSLAYQASKQLETLGDKISADEKKEIEDVLAELKANIESDNIEQLKISVKTLEEKLAVFLSQNGVGPDGVGVTPDTPTDDGVVDSEIKDV